MLDDPTLRDGVLPVVAELTEHVPQAAGRLMLVGALCRDVLHREWGHSFPLRRTGDLDLALAIDGWETYDEVVRELPRASGPAQVRHRIAGTMVDLVPFGGVEHPDGAVPLRRDADPLDVLGFRDVWADARPVALGDDLVIRLPTVAGYTALKLASWAARSRYGEYKDAGDLACASYWYLHSSTVEDRLYGDEHGQRILATRGLRSSRPPSWLRRSCSPTTLSPSWRPHAVPSCWSGGTASTTTCSRRTWTILCCPGGLRGDIPACRSTPGSLRAGMALGPRAGG
ncbi:hypothetical protein AB6N23_09335 [Cellulomonas sp. 179-A 9B4 NHS]|uniref:hypothetical protein n=1 Tax=Cellulomonas sp. 179-A 9B4 NHS TaxID=3142379 RepID=UPI0039A0632D